MSRRPTVFNRNGLSYSELRRRRPTSPMLGVTEKEFLDHVCTTAALWGWHGVHIIRSHGVMEGVHSLGRTFPRGADHDDAYGLPDLILVHPIRKLVAFVELKREGGRVRAGQVRWADWLRGTESTATYLWRPGDEQEIQRVLKEGWQ